MGFLFSVEGEALLRRARQVFAAVGVGSIVKKRERWYTIKLISYRYENGADSFGK